MKSLGPLLPRPVAKLRSQNRKITMGGSKDAASLALSAGKIAMVPIARLLPYAKNARTHSEAQVAKLAESIKEFGWTNPVLIDGQGGIRAGHGRVLAAQRLGIAEVPCLPLLHLSEAQLRAYVIADNQLALAAGWDMGLLSAELGALKDAGFELGTLGFSDEELGAIFSKARGTGLTDPDAAPPLPENPRSLLGDIWTLGDHRLVCGDSTDAETVALALAGVKPHLMVTDPPYGVSYDPAWRERAGFSSAGAAMGSVLNDDRADWREAWALFPGNVAYVWHGGLQTAVVAASLAASRFALRAQIVWVKTRPALSRGHYHWQHETALFIEREDSADDGWRYLDEHAVAEYAVREGSTAHWRGNRKQSTVWFIEHLKNDTGHGTQKPVECMQRPMINNSSAGQAVYEPFSGSGSSIIAAEICGRKCHAIELSPAYVDMAVKRWQDFTGERAVHAVTGEAFDARP